MTADVLDELPILDDATIARLHDLAARVAGEDLLENLVALFARDSAARIAAIGGALSRKDQDARRHAAHALKGAALSIGALRVAFLARTLETNDDDDALRALPNETNAAVNALRSRI